MRSRLLPLKLYLMWGHLAFVVVILVGLAAVISPIMGTTYISPAYRQYQLSLMPEWLGLVLQGHADAVPYAVGTAYAVCVAGSIVAWVIQERRARRYVQRRHGA